MKNLVERMQSNIKEYIESGKNKICLTCFRTPGDNQDYCDECLQLKSEGFLDEQIHYCEKCEQQCGGRLCNMCTNNLINK